jgi:hypothetical protein
MIHGHDFGPMVALCLANGVLLGWALGASRPGYYVALAAAAGTMMNLAYVVAGRLWQRP